MTGHIAGLGSTDGRRRSGFRRLAAALRDRGAAVADRLGRIDPALVDPSSCCAWIDDRPVHEPGAWAPVSA